MYWNSAHGITGIGVHKLNRPKVPEMVGVAVPITLILFAAIYAMIGGASSVPPLSCSLFAGAAAPVRSTHAPLKLPRIFTALAHPHCGPPLLVQSVHSL